MYIGKWLEELDACGDEFYLAMSDGLKHVLIGTFVHMKPTKNLTDTSIQQASVNLVYILYYFKTVGNRYN